MSKVGRMDVIYFAAEPEHFRSSIYRSSSLCILNGKGLLADSRWLLISASETGVYNSSPFTFAELPPEIQHLRGKGRNQAGPLPPFVSNFSDDLQPSGINSESAYETVEAYYQRFRGRPEKIVFIEGAVRDMRAIGDVALRLQILLSGHCRRPVPGDVHTPVS
ncbi:hypothetical protein M422DRAFT_265389 [Sphaerobolus stellatus SS14]|uniref:Uncharacterized protein n=1 Tax=Sphaerobolus stellatus (strain SS14) TaxID=990650 RepID=A0A0C9UU22_SPHS4|nr:hypothetical protein M422DRAFT_265389 [Sphaerobolus stellatus SS14]